ncbi:uncharacterized, partial [Tachysurus ichikawai]
MEDNSAPSSRPESLQRQLSRLLPHLKPRPLSPKLQRKKWTSLMMTSLQ